MEASVAAAFRGIGACAEKDTAGVKRQIATLQALEQSGHSEHRYMGLPAFLLLAFVLSMSKEGYYRSLR